VINPNDGLYKTSDIYLEDIEMHTDTSTLDLSDFMPESVSMKKVAYKRDFILNEAKRDQISSLLSDSVLAEFYIRKGFTNTITVRTPWDLLKCISYIGGLTNIIYVVALFSASYFTEINFLIKLANKLYVFPKKRKKKQEEHSKINSTDSFGQELKENPKLGVFRFLNHLYNY